MELTQESVEKLDVGQNEWALLCKGLLLDAIEAGDKLEAENERLKAELQQSATNCNKLKCLALHAMSELFYYIQDKYFRDGTCALSWEEKEMLDKRGGKYLNLRCKYLDAYRKAKKALREGK